MRHLVRGLWIAVVFLNHCVSLGEKIFAKSFFFGGIVLELILSLERVSKKICNRSEESKILKHSNLPCIEAKHFPIFGSQALKLRLNIKIKQLMGIFIKL